MDLICLNCSEPWDVLYVTEEADEFKRGTDLLTGKPNGKILRCPCCPEDGSSRPPRNVYEIAALAEVLGSDIDGLAAELEAYGLL